mmetsp:Transcript_57374/g.140698  ORF Transcript_57374/g.140698 Transcript_57374/m.140698 type:complete len:222 (+) Transcript_57374:233-898(+)
MPWRSSLRTARCCRFRRRMRTLPCSRRSGAHGLQRRACGGGGGSTRIGWPRSRASRKERACCRHQPNCRPCRPPASSRARGPMRAQGQACQPRCTRTRMRPRSVGRSSRSRPLCHRPRTRRPCQRTPGGGSRRGIASSGTTRGLRRARGWTRRGSLCRRTRTRTRTRRGLWSSTPCPSPSPSATRCGPRPLWRRGQTLRRATSGSRAYAGPTTPWSSSGGT